MIAPVSLRRRVQGAEGAAEEQKRLIDRRDAQVIDASHDDRVIASRVFGDDLTLEGGQSVGEQWYAGAADDLCECPHKSSYAESRVMPRPSRDSPYPRLDGARDSA